MPIIASDWNQIDSIGQSFPLTVASAATISPTTFLTILTGNVAVVTVNPPVTNTHMLAIQFAGTAGVTAAGNILTAKASVVGMTMLLIYNPITSKYVPVG